MNRYQSVSDDFYINMNLSTEMELPGSRETVLHYFERIQKKYPAMRKFYCRDKRDFVLEEDKDRGQYRWATVEPHRVCSGQVNPPTLDSALEQHQTGAGARSVHALGQPAGLRGPRPAVRF